MVVVLRNFLKSIPTLVLAFALALAVWISAVTSRDPVTQRLFPRPVTIERYNMDPSLVISNEIPNQAQVTINAPSSIWDQMLSDRAPVRAWIDLSGLEPGTHTLPVETRPLRTPAKIVNQSPQEVTVNLERLETRDFGITLVRRGEPAIGFEAEEPSLSQNVVTISGPTSSVERIRHVRATVDLSQSNEDINRSLPIQVLDASEIAVDGITITPEQVLIDQPISQLGGYRNVVVRVATTTNQVARGYRLTSISASPPIVTVFSTNPALIDRLPGVVDTSPLDLTGVKDDLEVRLPLNLPDGVEVVGDQTVLVQVGIAAIEGSLTLSNLPIEVIGLPEELVSRISPEMVDVILSGPVPLLDSTSATDVRVVLDLTGVSTGTYQFAPRVTIANSELRVESILPSSIEVVVELRSRARRTPSPTPTGTPPVSITPTAPTGQ